MGGEKIIEPSLLKIGGGSPPRRRGKATVAVRVNVPVRITPAQAGKSRRGGFCYVWTRDHPRVGGEKLTAQSQASAMAGSPPHGRGKDGESTGIGGADGITPAWAGKSLSRPPAGGRVWDHPRMGGEKRRTVQYPRRCVGSPPRGRGKVADGLLAGACPGITPAWAGKSREIPLHLRAAKDHPCVGGEKL